jgi:hypothetical protein
VPPLQSLTILLARVVFPELGGPYRPIFAFFFPKILFIQAPIFFLKPLKKPIYILDVDRAKSILIIFHTFKMYQARAF